MLIPHYCPLCAPTFTYFSANLFHVRLIHSVFNLIWATGVIWQSEELVDGGYIVLFLLPSDKHNISGVTLRYVRKKLTNHRHKRSILVYLEQLQPSTLNDPLEVLHSSVFNINVEPSFFNSRTSGH